MTSERDEQEFVDRVRSAWGRPELSAREHAELDADLRARLGEPAPRRWALPAGAGLALAAVVAIVLSMREPVAEAGGWVDDLIEAQAVVLGEHAYSDTFDLSETTEEQTENADPVWDLSADEAWDSDDASLDLGHEYEVLAYWLASPTDGNQAESDTGASTPAR